MRDSYQFSAKTGNAGVGDWEPVISNLKFQI